MSTFLFNNTVFGPVKSRRLGISLGINLLPNDSKLCSFDCIYCECGWNPDYREVKSKLPERDEVKELLEKKLIEMNQKGNFLMLLLLQEMVSLLYILILLKLLMILLN
jgi:wyosine [tRNA(Phe)-imidazoG37] synthetase (radical SAM superfamily)